jgi:hypothetical protein
MTAPAVRLEGRRNEPRWPHLEDRREAARRREPCTPSSAELPIGSLDSRRSIRHDALVATATYATLAAFRIDLSRETEQRESLNRLIVPSVTSSPGFVSGTWTLDREQSESMVLVTFDSRSNAQAFVDNVRANAPNQAMVGIELLDVRVVEVSASA